VKPRW